MLQYYEDILDIALRLMDVTGIHPEKLRILPVLITLTFLVSELVLGILSFVFEELNVINIALSASNVGAIIHAVLKFFVIFFHRKELYAFIQEMKQMYWPPPPQTPLESDYLDILKIWKLLIQFNFIYFGAFAVLMPFYMLLGGERAFPGYIPKFAPKHSGFMFDVIFCFTLLPYVSGVDCLVSSLFLLLRVQFKILNEAISNFDYDQKLADSKFKKVMIGVYVEQHRFLLGHCQKLNDIFGNMFMLFIWIEALVMCFQLYVVSQELIYSPQTLMRPMGMLAAACMELLTFYFMPTHLLMDEASKSSDSIVNSNWYKCPDEKVRKSLVFFIMATQRGVKILAGNWIPMSIATCLLIYRTAFSFYTFIKTVSRVRA